MKILSNKIQINIRVYEEIKIRADVTENMFKVLILIFFYKQSWMQIVAHL